MAKFAGSIPNQGTHKYQPMNSPPAPTFLSLSKINNKCLNIHKSGRQKVHMLLNMVTLQEVDIEAPSLSTLGLGRLSRQGNHVIISLYCSNTLLLIDKSLASVAHILPIAIYCSCALCPRTGTFQLLKHKGPRGMGQGK